MPENLQSLHEAVTPVTRAEVDVVILTSGVQLAHMFQGAAQMGVEQELRRGLHHTVIASIGPTTSEEIVRLGLNPDLEASHPKMGLLVREAAERSVDLIATMPAEGKSPTISVNRDG